MLKFERKIRRQKVKLYCPLRARHCIPLPSLTNPLLNLTYCVLKAHFSIFLPNAIFLFYGYSLARICHIYHVCCMRCPFYSPCFDNTDIWRSLWLLISNYGAFYGFSFSLVVRTVVRLSVSSFTLKTKSGFMWVPRHHVWCKFCVFYVIYKFFFREKRNLRKL